MAMHGIGNNAGEHVAKRGSEIYGTYVAKCLVVVLAHEMPMIVYKSFSGRYALMGTVHMCKGCVFGNFWSK